MEVVEQALQQLFVPWHLLKAGKQVEIFRYRLDATHIFFHKVVVSNVANFESSLRVSIQNFCDEILAICTKEFRHLVVGRHYLLVEITCFGVFERKITSHHCVENYAGAPNISL